MTKKKINGDVKPFIMVESYFTDTKFFEEDAALEITPAVIFSTGKGSVMNVKETGVPSEESGDGSIKPQQQ